MSTSGPHIVRIDRKKNLSSDTLVPADLQRLESAFRSAPWWRDRWTNRIFRAAALGIARERGGLALIGPGMSFDNPPPFGEFFEPIEIARGLGDNSDELKTLSGPTPTRQERISQVFIWILWLAGLVLIIGMIVAFFRGLPTRAVLGLAGAGVLFALIMMLVVVIHRLAGRWYLLPGGIAIVRRPARRGQAPRVTVLSRAETCLALRYVSNGKTVTLKLELWTPLAKRLERPVSEREAISVLAAWQSPHRPPPDERLQELSW